jgi:hypothetical protein
VSGPTIDRAGSSGDIWTPWPFIAAVQRKFGYLDWDLAASSVNRRATNWIDEEQNSLTVDWHKLGGLHWLNPPFGNITPWGRKCAEEVQLGWRGLVLAPGSIGANWYWDWMRPYADVYSVGRIVFDNCFNKQGELVTTPYPKDLILAHYYSGAGRRRMRRWRWQEEAVDAA